MRRALAFALLVLSILTSACAETTAPEVALTVSPTTATVTEGLAQNFVATVTGTTNAAVTWSVQEGATGGTIGPTGAYTAPATPGSYHVIATSVADAAKSASATVTVVAAPMITSFVAAKMTLTAGGGTTLIATFTGGTGTVNQSVGMVTSAAAAGTGTLTASQTYTLTVTNAAGTAVTAQVTVTVVPAPVITSFTATPGAIATGATVSLQGVFANGTGYLNPGGAVVTSPLTTNSAVLTANAAFTLVVKNAAGDSVTSTANVAVYTAPPTINSFTAAPTIITVGDSTLLAWNVTDASSLSIDQGVGVVTGSSRWRTPGGTTTYMLSATNPFGTVTATANATVVFAPTITRLVAAPSVVTTGSGTKLYALFNGGTASINQGVGAVLNGDSVATPALAVNTTFTLTVTNLAGRAVTANTAVGVDAGGFAATGPMGLARERHTSVALADGTVLAMGGFDAGATSTAETYDPATGLWSATAGPMSSARIGAVAVLLADGRVLVTGGFNFKTAEIYDPATRLFTPTDSMATIRYWHTLHLLADGRVLLFGGYDGSGAALFGALLYDPRTGLFTSTGTLGASRRNAQAFTLANGMVAVVGGGSSSENLTTVELYDPTLGLFGPTSGTTGGLVNTVRLLDGSLLAVSVGTQAYRWLNGATSLTGQMVRFRAGAAVVVLPGSQVLVQADSGAPGSEGRSEAEIFNPTTGTFRLTARTVTGRGGSGAHLLQNGKVLLLGGFGAPPGGSPQALNASELFDAGSGLAAAAPSAVIAAAANVLAGAAGIVISVPSTSGARYVWQVTNGTVTAGLRTNSITLTAGVAGTMAVRVLVISELQIPATGAADVTVLP